MSPGFDGLQKLGSVQRIVGLRFGAEAFNLVCIGLFPGANSETSPDLGFEPFEPRFCSFRNAAVQSEDVVATVAFYEGSRIPLPEGVELGGAEGELLNEAAFGQEPLGQTLGLEGIGGVGTDEAVPGGVGLGRECS